MRDMLHSPPGTDFPEVARALEGRYGSGGMRVQNVGVHHMGGEGGPHTEFSPLGHVNIYGEIASDADPANNEGGYFRVTATQTRKQELTDPLYYSVHLDRMHVRGGAQGGGGGRELTDRIVAWARQSGMKEITVGPSEVGSYAWGAMGFDFDSMESRRIAWEGAMTMTPESVRQHFSWGDLEGRVAQLSDAEIKKMIRQYRYAATRALAGTMSYQKLSQYGRKPGQDKDDWWAGKLGLIVGGVGGGRIRF